MKIPAIPKLAAEHLLPPRYRAQVLGDLEERFRNAPPEGAARQYWTDAFSATYSILLGRTAVVNHRSDLRKRADAFQDSLWRRNIGHSVAFLLLTALVVLSGSFRATRFSSVIGLLPVVVLALQARARWTLGSAQPVPPSLSDQELRQFHRAALKRHLDFTSYSHRTLYLSLGLWLALLLPFRWSEIVNMPDYFWGLAAFPFSVMVAFLIPLTRTNIAKYVQTIQTEIDSL
jgi:hypothetical protein